MSVVCTMDSTQFQTTTYDIAQVNKVIDIKYLAQEHNTSKMAAAGLKLIVQ